MQIKITRVRKRKMHLSCDEELGFLSTLITKTLRKVNFKKVIIASSLVITIVFLINSGNVAFSYNVFCGGAKIGTVKDTANLESAYNMACEKNGEKIQKSFSIYPSLCFMGNFSKESELCENILLSSGNFKRGFALKMGEDVIFLAKDEQIILALINEFEKQNKIKLEGDFKIEYGIFKNAGKNYKNALHYLKEMQNEVVEETGFLQPVVAEVSSYFGKRWGREHKGIDFAANEGDSILAANDGKVKFSGFESSFGNLVIIEHDGGYDSYYAHMSKRSVAEGETVSKGQKIGEVGSTGNSTGPHLHFEIRYNGNAVNPEDFIVFQ